MRNRSSGLVLDGIRKDIGFIKIAGSFAEKVLKLSPMKESYWRPM